MPDFGRAPSRAVSLSVSAALVVLWGVIRLALFETTVFPLTYALPLLICVWTRDRIALWGMAAIFNVFHAIKLFWLVPADLFTPAEIWANYGATVANVTVAGSAVHLIILLRLRLEESLRQVRAQAEELQAQGEELAQQNEELASQAEELTQQTEELSQQQEELASHNEVLEARSDEIRTLNDALTRREALLQALLEIARLAGPEEAAFVQIARTGRDLFGESGTAVAVYECTPDGMRLIASAPAGSDGSSGAPPAEHGFVGLVLAQKRTASLNDAALRPDLPLPAVPGQPPFRAALCAPIHVGDDVFGVCAVGCDRPHEWTDEEFRLAEWLADQCGRVLQALRAQSDLRDADRRKDAFLATLSHELRNPLAPIRFALDLIEPGDERQAEAIRVLRRQVQQLVRLVDDLLEATRLTSNKVQIRRARVDLVPIVREAVDDCRPDFDAAGQVLTVTLPPHAVWTDADAERMAQVVMNLLNNATRYTPAGGRVTATLTARAGEAVLSVADTGIGLEPADCERVFDMFTQLDGPGSGGLGIGLALVRGIVQGHGGRVEARSEGRGRGCEFRVMLPVAEAPEQAETMPGAPPAETMPASRVLVVDDNVDSAQMIGTLLELHGHTVRVAHDAKSALAAAEEFAPHAALLDIGLPGTDGYQLARALRDNPRTRHVRLVAVTGWGQDGDRARAREAGFDQHLTKPAEPDALLAAVGSGEPT